MKKKSKRAQIITSLAMILLSITTLIGSIFAWITTGTVTSISYEFKFEQVTNMEVSLGDTNIYKTSFTADELMEAVATELNHGPLPEDESARTYMSSFNFNAVTTTDGINFKKMNSRFNGYEVLDADNYNLSYGYIELDFHFRSTTKLDIYPSSQTYVRSNGVSFLSNYTVDTNRNVLYQSETTSDKIYFGSKTSMTQNEVYTGYAQNAARISYTSMGNKNLNGTKPAVVYEPNITNPNNTGTYASANNLGTAYINKYLEGKYGVSRLIPNTNVKKDTLQYTSVTGLVDLDSTDNDPSINVIKSPIISLSEISPRNFHGTVTARVWLEGWDPDGFVAIQKDNLFVSFSFVGLSPETPR